MTFEEFFRKKRIDLAALKQADGALFTEFKLHYEEMGEKSFDHTKKYWFNKTRRQYPLPPEVKTEKPHLANPLAEQTITKSLTEPITTPSTAKLGFAPKFRAGVTAKPASETQEKKEELPSAPAPEAIPPSTKPGFTPRFKAGLTSKSAADPSEEKEASPTPPAPETAVSPGKPGFTPRFKAGITSRPLSELQEKKAKLPEPDPQNQKDAVEKTTKPSYVPKFKMQHIKPKNDTE